VVLGTVLAIALVVVVGRAVGDSRPDPTRFVQQGPTGIATPTGPAPGDDGVIATPSSIPPSDEAAIRARVGAFMKVWLDRKLSPAEWQQQIAAMSTTSVANSLVGADPLTVPATRITGDIALPVLTASLAQAIVPVDSGTVTLTLTKNGNRWLIAGIDWTRG
jgi:hypothetical protein